MELFAMSSSQTMKEKNELKLVINASLPWE